MVPNAGIGRPVPLVAMDLEEWRAVTSVNLDGVFLCIRYGAPAIAESGGGSIVNICSITAQAGTPLIAHYSAAKAGVMSLTQSASVEFRAQNIRVNAILPGLHRDRAGHLGESRLRAPARLPRRPVRPGDRHEAGPLRHRSTKWPRWPSSWPPSAPASPPAAPSSSTAAAELHCCKSRAPMAAHALAWAAMNISTLPPTERPEQKTHTRCG